MIILLCIVILYFGYGHVRDFMSHCCSLWSAYYSTCLHANPPSFCNLFHKLLLFMLLFHVILVKIKLFRYIIVYSSLRKGLMELLDSTTMYFQCKCQAFCHRRKKFFVDAFCLIFARSMFSQTNQILCDSSTSNTSYIYLFHNVIR